ncbi:hypothetical protein HNY73_003591 [Argiope bruennichi]|uniref:Uncharacterized protein n=1 Tax=Argiope bruennichi TaxID=94029 RepID=A0A8T0FP35_ARGBR|nr:hypothetical protein HNY73_003591 [Argiope bruennichi]
MEQLPNALIIKHWTKSLQIREHKLWLLREAQAQREFQKKQEQLEQEKIKLEEERKRIVAEFEKQQLLESKKEDENQKLKTQKESKGPWHNPIAPENYSTGTERELCQFFVKTGCCRFGEREEEAVKAYQQFQWPIYAGKQLLVNFHMSLNGNLQFVVSTAISCMFSKNPTNEFWDADRDRLSRDSHSPKSKIQTKSERKSSHHSYFDESRSYRDSASERRNDYSYQYRSTDSDEDILTMDIILHPEEKF